MGPSGCWVGDSRHDWGGDPASNGRPGDRDLPDQSGGRSRPGGRIAHDGRGPDPGPDDPGRAPGRANGPGPARGRDPSSDPVRDLVRGPDPGLDLAHGPTGRREIDCDGGRSPGRPDTGPGHDPGQSPNPHGPGRGWDRCVGDVPARTRACRGHWNRPKADYPGIHGACEPSRGPFLSILARLGNLAGVAAAAAANGTGRGRSLCETRGDRSLDLVGANRGRGPAGTGAGHRGGHENLDHDRGLGLGLGLGHGPDLDRGRGGRDHGPENQLC
ncbi:hypothetical protein BDW42DRAFT_170514 [Aspergillus taichungensis]|uniref:Uncharacterized protein n=1 Tax=Aspergillus taichungensis TaxID=482145 RepID=A0A2J5HTJ4_9EURO|nr:hypothetical protein BDW42DRAFT_170514 [Aspergillus taichungensis]